MRCAIALLAALLAGCRPPPPIEATPGPGCIATSPEEIDFGEVKNLKLVSRNVKVTNLSGARQSLRFEVSGPPFSTEGPDQLELAVGRAVTRLVQFFHDDSLLHLGKITIDGGPECQATIPLRGLGEGTVHLVPEVLDFGFVPHGEQKTLELSFVNTRRVPVTVFNLHFSPVTTTAFVSLQGPELTLPPLSTVTVAVTAIPPSDSAFEASFTAMFDAEILESQLKVVGAGPVAEFASSAIVVPTVGFALPSFPPSFVDRELWLRNASPTISTLEAALRIVPPFFKVEAPEGGSIEELSVTIPTRLTDGLPPGGEAPLEFHLVPRSLGPRSYRVTFFTNDPVRPEHVITLEANVQALPECSLSVAPAEELRLARLLGMPSVGTVTFTNSGLSSCVLDDVRFDQPVTKGFSLQDAPSQLRITPGESHVVRVSGPNGVFGTSSTLGFHVLNASSVRQHLNVVDQP